MTISVAPRTLADLQSTLPEVQYPLSPAYRSARTPEEYATQIDADSLLADFMAAARAFALNPANLNVCAHNPTGIISPIRNSDPKIDAGLKKLPGVLATIIRSERLKTVHKAREAVHNAIAHR